MTRHNSSISISGALGARTVLKPLLAPAPLRNYPSLDRLTGATLFIKHENHNPTGTFKIRGGLTLMHHLSTQNLPGVITYSTGNHGSSVAASAARFGLKAVVVVPENANPLKCQSIRDAGAQLIESGADFEAAGQKVDQMVEEKGFFFVHPANEPHIIHGVATEFLEIIEALPQLDVLIIPIGAGSEAAAAITVLRKLSPKTKIIAVQAQQAPAACLSWQQGRITTAANTTFAGGVATGTAYDLPFSLYRDGLADFVLLSEEELYQGIALAAHHTRNLAEGAGAACLMAAVKIRDQLKGKTVVVQMSGGNASPEEIEKAMALPCLHTGTPAPGQYGL